MELLHDFSFLEQRLRGMSVRKCIALACPHDTHTEYVIERALGEGFARFVLTTAGPLSPRLARVAEAHAGLVDIVVCADAAEASREAVAVVRRGEADVLMKGTVNTDVLLRRTRQAMRTVGTGARDEPYHDEPHTGLRETADVFGCRCGAPSYARTV